MTPPRPRTKTLPLALGRDRDRGFHRGLCVPAAPSGKPGQAFQPVPRSRRTRPAHNACLPSATSASPLISNGRRRSCRRRGFAPTVAEVAKRVRRSPRGTRRRARRKARPAGDDHRRDRAPRDRCAGHLRARNSPAPNPTTGPSPTTCCLFRKERQLFLLPDFRKPGGQLLARGRKASSSRGFPPRAWRPAAIPSRCAAATPRRPGSSR